MAIESEDSAALVVKLGAADLPQLNALLEQNSLPSDDCEAQLPAFFGIFEADRLIAAGGLQVAANDGLLRSLVVGTDRRGCGLAAAITHFLIADARRRGLDSIYLLTETADAYFTRFGFVRVAREMAPEAIARTRQFAGLCPDSAVFMRLTLDRR